METQKYTLIFSLNNSLMLQNNAYFIEFWNWLSNIMTIKTFVMLIIAYFFIVWISIIVWVIRDITNRTDSLFLQFFSILLVILWTPLWIFLYLLIRPTKTLFERYYEEVEHNLDALTSSIASKIEWTKKKTMNCPCCNYPIDNAFKFCPNCKEELKFKCKSCDKKIDKQWKICAHCGQKKPYSNKKDI